MDSVLKSLKLQIINQRNQLIQSLDIQYSNYINQLMLQKLSIAQKIQNQYDEQVSVINDMILGHCNNNNQQYVSLLQAIDSIQSIYDHQPSTYSTFDNIVTSELKNRNKNDTKYHHESQKQTSTILKIENSTQYIKNQQDIDTQGQHVTSHKNVAQPKPNNHNNHRSIKSKKPLTNHMITVFDAFCAKCFETDKKKPIIKCSKCFAVYHINCVQREPNRFDENYICETCTDNKKLKVIKSRRSIRLKNKSSKKQNMYIPQKTVVKLVTKQKQKRYRDRSRNKGRAPSYKFMILEAIDLIGTPENGCSRQRISTYIQTNYGFQYGLATGNAFNTAIRRALTNAIDTMLLTKLSPSGQCYKLSITGETILSQLYKKYHLQMNAKKLGFIGLNAKNCFADDCSSAYVQHMSIEQASKLTINDKIDHRDRVGRFLEALIVDMKGSMLKIRYAGFGDEVWSDYKKELNKFATYKSISKRSELLPNNRFLVDYKKHRRFYDILPAGGKEWKLGEVIEFDRKSGQVKFFYYMKGYRMWWIHCDNEKELQPLNTKQLRSSPNKTYKEVINDKEESKYLSSYHENDISYFAAGQQKTSVKYVYIKSDKNKQVALNSELYKLWELKEEKIKSDHKQSRGLYRVNTLALAAMLRTELEKFIIENKLVDVVISRYNGRSFISMKHFFVDLLIKKYCLK
eukprot:221259_1